VHSDEPAVAENVPTVQEVQSLIEVLPIVEVVPAGHDAHVVDRVISSATAPARAYFPAGLALVSGPVHESLVSPIVEPYFPAGQGVHAVVEEVAPETAYVPMKHVTLAVQALEVKPVVEPNVPAGQGVHAAVAAFAATPVAVE